MGLESGRKIRSEWEGQSFVLVIFGREKGKRGALLKKKEESWKLQGEVSLKETFRVTVRE